MIQKIIHISDIHIKRIQRHEETKEILINFINDIKPFCEEYKDKVVIMISGDLFDNKLDISSESQILMSWFLHELDNLCATYYFAGNHDFTQNNLDRIDALTPIFEIGNFKRTSYLDKITGYKSGIIEDRNVCWVLYSIFDNNYSRPNIEKIKEEKHDKLFIGLIHAPILNSKTDIGFTINRGINPDVFSNCDFVICGDIHKKQLLTSKDSVKMYYAGSLLQQNFGENITNHGFSIITLPNFDIEFHEVDNPYLMYKFEINDKDDILNNKEVLING